MRNLLLCLVSALIGGLVAIAATQTPLFSPTHAVAQNRDERGPLFPLVEPEPRPETPRQPLMVQPKVNRPANPPIAGGLTDYEQINVAVYENANRSVVHITTKTSRPDPFFLVDRSSEGSGSGTVIDKSGHILTNFHVIEGAGQMAVTMFDGKTYDAEFVGADPINDIAVVKVNVEQEKLHPVEITDSSHLKVGMRVFTIGNPFGLERSMTTGIIASLNRSLQIRGNRTIKSIIQIDASVNPGNSGGPLLDTAGRLIGINTAIASKNGQSAGVGFAIPANLVSRVVPQLIRHGRVIRPEVGIARVYETDEGLLIARLTPNGPAERAGLRGPRMIREQRGPFLFERIDRAAADLIIAVDGRPVRTADEFMAYIESQPVHSDVTLTIVRNGRETRIKVRLGGPVLEAAPRRPIDRLENPFRRPGSS